MGTLIAKLELAIENIPNKEKKYKNIIYIYKLISSHCSYVNTSSSSSSCCI